MFKKKYLTFIYYILLFCLFCLYFIKVEYLEKFYIDELKSYLGIMAIPVSIFFILYGLIFLFKDKTRKFIFEVKLYIFLIFTFFIAFSVILTLERNNIFTSNVINYEYFIKQCLDNYNLGFIATYFLYNILLIQLEFNYLLYGVYSISSFLLFLIIFSPIKKSLKRALDTNRENRAKRRQERELREQIYIREAAQKREAIRIKKLEQNKEIDTSKRVKEVKIQKENEGHKLVNIINIEDED